MIGLQQIKLETYGNTNVFNVKNMRKSDEFILVDSEGLLGSSMEVTFQQSVYSGSVHMGTRTNEREINLTFLLNPTGGHTVSDLRDQLYSHIVSDRNTLGLTKITLIGSEDTAYIMGRVSQIEADLHTDDPRIQMTFMCNSAYFTSSGAIESFTKTFTSKTSSFDIINPGAATGFFFSLKTDAAITKFALTNTTNGQSLHMGSLPSPAGAPTSFGVEIKTEETERYIRAIFSSGSEWAYLNSYDNNIIKNGLPTLESGRNTITFSVEGGGTNLATALTYSKLYSGV